MSIYTCDVPASNSGKLLARKSSGSVIKLKQFVVHPFFSQGITTNQQKKGNDD